MSPCPEPRPLTLQSIVPPAAAKPSTTLGAAQIASRATFSRAALLARAVFWLQVDERRAVKTIEAADLQGGFVDPDQLDNRRGDRVRPYRRAQRECAGGFLAVGSLRGEVAPRQVHPVEHLNALVASEPGQRLAPALVDGDRADRAVRGAALRAFLASLPGCVDHSDEIKASVGLRRQLDRHLAGTQIVVVHAGTRAGIMLSSPAGRGRSVALSPPA